MTKEQYQSCMTSGMRSMPKGISREQRGLEFCVIAKQCSGKAKSRDEALEICSHRPPKPFKEKKRRQGRTCEQDAFELATCMGNTVSYPLPNNRGELQRNLQASIEGCQCQKK